MTRDVIVDEIRRVRDELVKRHGGLDGWIAHLQAMDRARRRKAKQITGKKAVASGTEGNGRTPPKGSSAANAWKNSAGRL